MKLTIAWRRVLEARGHKVEAIASKHGNVRTTTADNITHASKRQADRWIALHLMQRAKRVRDLRREVRYPITVKGVEVCIYIADHVYEERQKDGTWTLIVEDVKGQRTPVYKLKKRLMRACLGIEIREV